jgi:predicted amidohydrolase
MNGAELIYRPSYPEPYVGNGLWEVQNRARAVDNTCYMICPNPASYAPAAESAFPLDMFGGKSMIVDYQGRIIGQHESGGAASYAGAIINIEGLREYRERTLWGNWIKDLRTEQYRLIYDQPLYEKNRCMTTPPLKHAENDKVVRAAVDRVFKRGIWKRPTR